MIKAIYSDVDLNPFHCDKVEENGVNVLLDEDFYDENGGLKRDEIANLSVDTYYNSLGLVETPPSPDNLIVIKRGETKYSIYIIELKNVAKLRSVKADNIKKKFETAIKDFMNERFSHVFNKEGTKLADLSLWLVCNRFKFIDSDISEEDYMRKVRGGLMESLLLTKPYTFRNKIVRVELMLSGKDIL
ncbi:hypothetical protein K3G69_18820 [Phytobacter diazotrophicus]|uniref:hypothetical protein n=1 Tax=Phytobacter diazotrophicus TaxID=395631 RepID=UPI001C9A2369|nr:hypothetical protein [Phytobacter diazotrophicus]MBY6258551.1 hypothetical protein [Phytobacter diazotrophicus]